jgi:hypothetical protein
MRGALMAGFDWDVLGVGLAAALGVGLIALTAIRRRRTRRRTQLAQADPGTKRRRIDVVAIDEDAEHSPEQERNA